MGPAVTSTSPPWAGRLNLYHQWPGHHFYITTLGPVIEFIPPYGPGRHFYITTLGLVVRFYTTTWARPFIPPHGPDCQFYITILGRLLNSTHMGPTFYITTLGPVVKFYPPYGPDRQLIYHHMGPAVNSTTLGPVVNFYTIIWAQLSILNHHPGPVIKFYTTIWAQTIKSTSPPWARHHYMGPSDPVQVLLSNSQSSPMGQAVNIETTPHYGPTRPYRPELAPRPTLYGRGPQKNLNFGWPCNTGKSY
ncbi:hypothetical protein DFH29DRAFT_879216 [Suillus ampliporus]|nr:hypothetical protein DFH29DRAFT_879216 [Suillus ampliporus]